MTKLWQSKSYFCCTESYFSPLLTLTLILLHTHFALCTKCSIHLAWLIKRLLPRLPAPLSTRQIALLFKDLVHYVFLASGKVFTNNFRRTAFFIQLHANKDFQSSCELVTYTNSKFQRLFTHIIQELLLSILERNRPRKQFSLRSGHLHVHTSQSLRTVYFSMLSNNLSNWRHE